MPGGVQVDEAGEHAPVGLHGKKQFDRGDILIAIEDILSRTQVNVSVQDAVPTRARASDATDISHNVGPTIELRSTNDETEVSALACFSDFARRFPELAVGQRLGFRVKSSCIHIGFVVEQVRCVAFVRGEWQAICLALELVDAR